MPCFAQAFGKSLLRLDGLRVVEAAESFCGSSLLSLEFMYSCHLNLSLDPLSSCVLIPVRETRTHRLHLPSLLICQGSFEPAHVLSVSLDQLSGFFFGKTTHELLLLLILLLLQDRFLLLLELGLVLFFLFWPRLPS